MDILIGIDPDSKAHGVAIYVNGKLENLHMWTTPEIVAYLYDKREHVRFAIEDVKRNNSVWKKKGVKNFKANTEVGRSLGLVQQSQVELERWLDVMQIPYECIKPQRGNWAKLKGPFEKATGWAGRSNADTRSAAFIGMLGLRRKKAS